MVVYLVEKGFHQELSLKQPVQKHIILIIPQGTWPGSSTKVTLSSHVCLNVMFSEQNHIQSILRDIQIILL